MKERNPSILFSALAIIGAILIVLSVNENLAAGMNPIVLRTLGVIFLVVGIGGAALKLILEVRAEKKENGKKK